MRVFRNLSAKNNLKTVSSKSVNRWKRSFITSEGGWGGGRGDFGGGYNFQLNKLHFGRRIFALYEMSGAQNFKTQQWQSKKRVKR